MTYKTKLYYLKAPFAAAPKATQFEEETFYNVYNFGPGYVFTLPTVQTTLITQPSEETYMMKRFLLPPDHCWPEPAAAVSKKGCGCDKELDSPGVWQY